MIFRVFLFLLIACSQYFSYAQFSDTARFNRLYRFAIENVANLHANKGVNYYCDQSKKENYASDVINLAASYGDKADSLGMLFYFFDKDSLSIWLYKNKEFHFANVVLTYDTLFRMEYELRTALRVESLKQSGNRSLRGGELFIIDTTKKISLDAAIARTTKILLPPSISGQLTGLTHLMIIPQLNIGRIPFAILRPFPSGAFLIDSVSLSFAPHLCNMKTELRSDPAQLGKPKKYESWNPLVIGNPTFNSDEFMPLPGAEDEAKKVAALLKTQALIGKEATISMAKWKSYDADLLYFATHGYFDMESMLEGSYLAFAADNNNKTGKWTASEIHKNHLNADLAILSACQTGIGRAYEAGFIGLGRTFYMAGVRNTVTSLWSVDDKATVDLMVEFVNQLKKPDYFYPSQHLRKAMLEYKKLDKDISHWGAFMVFGYSY